MTSPEISLITATGMRLEPLKLCAHYVQRFMTYLPDTDVEWVVVDDGATDSIADLACMDHGRLQTNFIRPKHRWSPGSNTLGINLLIALQQAKGNAIFFIEDDDWYDERYVQYLYTTMNTFNVSIIGETPSRYYHLPTKQYRFMENNIHASLCQTCIDRSVVEDLQNLCRYSPDLIDFRLWSLPGHKRLMRRNIGFTVGMKGLPGRPGLGMGHRPASVPGWKLDPDYSTLRGWIGEDFRMYQNFLV